MKSKSKKVAAALALILSGLSVSAQTVTNSAYSKTEYLTIQAQCLNKGAGLTVAFSGKEFEIFHYVANNGIENGFLFYTGGLLYGNGSNGVAYVAKGSFDENFADFNPTTGDGVFTINEDFLITGTKNGIVFERRLLHRIDKFTFSNNGQTATINQDETICK